MLSARLRFDAPPLIKPTFRAGWLGHWMSLFQTQSRCAAIAAKPSARSGAFPNGFARTERALCAGGISVAYPTESADAEMAHLT
jgi:hypothetical protein